MKRNLTEKNYNVLKSNELFCGLEGEALEQALDFFMADTAVYEKGECLHRVGRKMTRFGLVLGGRVQVRMDDIDGNPIIMANVTAGKTFGESLCFLGVEEEPVMIQAAVAKTEILWLKTDNIRKKTEDADGKNHEMTMRFITLVTGKTLSMNDRIQILSKKSLREKLIVFFSQCAHQYGGNSFVLPFNRNEMAEYLGTNRSALSRELAKMQKEQILRFSKDKFEIIKRT